MPAARSALAKFLLQAARQEEKGTYKKLI